MENEKPRFWLTERIIIILLVIPGLLVLALAVLFLAQTLTAANVAIITLLAGMAGALGTALGQIVQSAFKSDRAEKDNAAASAILAAKMPAHGPTGGVGGDVVAVRVEQPPGEPVPVTAPQPTGETE